jgi:hypothetical protein
MSHILDGPLVCAGGRTQGENSEVGGDFGERRDLMR